MKRMTIGGTQASRVSVHCGRSRRRVVPAAIVAASIAVSGAGCTAHESGGAGQDPLVIGVDLPMQGPSGAASVAAVDVLRLYLDSIHNRVGRFRIKLKLYDDSTVSSGTWDPQECEKNARKHVGTASEIAVIGARNSDCSKIEAPILNQARRGPLLMVSPRSTNPGLTKNWGPNEPAKYRPSGRLSFARVVPTDDHQGAAAAQFAARDLAVKRCYLLDDGQMYGKGVAEVFATEARRQGITVTGAQSWDSSHPNYRTMFAGIGDTAPDCVYLAGLIDHHGSQLIRDKVKVLGGNDKVKLIASDGFTGYSDLQRLPEAEGMYLTYAGLAAETVESAGGVGARLITAYRKGHGSNVTTDLALYAAQALQVVLAAVEHSDGSRGGVVDAVFSAPGISIPGNAAVLGRDIAIDPTTGDVVGRDVSVKWIHAGHEAFFKDWSVT